MAGNFGGPGTADEVGNAARLYGPGGMTIDAAGTVYFTDNINCTLRKMDRSGRVSTLAGSAGTLGFADGVGLSALFRGPNGVAVDAQGSVYVADTNNHVIRRVTASGTVTTFAGTPTVAGFADGMGGAATFNQPSGLTWDSSGNLLVVDSGNHAIRTLSVASRAVSTLAGNSGTAGYVDGAGASAKFNYPAQIIRTPDGSYAITDGNNHLIRRMQADGTVSTLAGQAGSSGFANGPAALARFNNPAGIFSDAAGNLHVADLMNYCLRKITPAGAVSTLAGTCTRPGTLDGSSQVAQFIGPFGLVADSTGRLLISDITTHTLRSLSPQGEVSTIAGLAEVSGWSDGLGASATFTRPYGIFVDGTGTVLVADRDNHRIRAITSAGLVTTLANWPAAYPEHVVADAAGNRYFSSGQKSVILKVDPSGNSSILAGSWGVTGTADGPSASARFFRPIGLAVDAQGNIFVADQASHTIRKITPAGEVSTFAGTAGLRGSQDGLGALARFYSPRGLGIDRQGNLYVADSNNFTVRKIAPDGNVTTVAGRAGQSGSTDGPVAVAKFSSVSAVAPDDEGNVYVADPANGTIRKVDTRGVVSTFAGVTGVHSFKAGPLPGLLNQPSGVAVKGPTLYITTSNGVAAADLK